MTSKGPVQPKAFDDSMILWFSGGLGSATLTVGLDLKGPFQPVWFYVAVSRTAYLWCSGGKQIYKKVWPNSRLPLEGASYLEAEFVQWYLPTSESCYAFAAGLRELPSV